MQYQTANVFEHADPHPSSSRPGYLPLAILAVVATLGLATHHPLLVIIGLIAALLFHSRMQSSRPATQPGASARIARLDGGSFPGAAHRTADVAGGHPSVLDGGCVKHAPDVGRLRTGS